MRKFDKPIIVDDGNPSTYGLGLFVNVVDVINVGIWVNVGVGIATWVQVTNAIINSKS